MKVGMYIRKKRGREEYFCMMICAHCGEPVEDIREANFAPLQDHDEPAKILRPGGALKLIGDDFEIWHWGCDADHTVPWKNAADALKNYLKTV